MAKVSNRDKFIEAAKAKFGNVDTINRQQAMDICSEMDIAFPAWLNKCRVERGVYSLAAQPVAVAAPKKVATPPMPESVVPSVNSVSSEAHIEMALAAVQIGNAPVSFVPEKAEGYVPFGHFNDVRSIVKSTQFYPLYITGLSGNGKTMMVEQVCAAEKRECIRTNITIETDEDDLLGGFRLIDGKTVWQNGPVVVAMERGAILLLDEVDLGSNKLMCLQPVLEGKPIYLKKINKVITPAKGFNIIATANTKGKGSDDGRFIGTNVMNEAFLERFSVTLEQEYPVAKTEAKILNNVLIKAGLEDKQFVDKLVTWAEVIRKSFVEGAVSDIISTRRLVHICEAFAIFNGNREKAVELCLNRFDVDTKTSFLDLYKKVDETISPPAPSATTTTETKVEVVYVDHLHSWVRTDDKTPVQSSEVIVDSSGKTVTVIKTVTPATPF